jgi:hypothetical protein
MGKTIKREFLQGDILRYTVRPEDSMKATLTFWYPDKSKSVYLMAEGRYVLVDEPSYEKLDSWTCKFEKQVSKGNMNFMQRCKNRPKKGSKYCWKHCGKVELKMRWKEWINSAQGSRRLTFKD